MELTQINSPIEISGLSDDKPYIELTTRLCYLNYANLNGVGLSSNADESYKSLIGMPLVAKINSDGTKFGSHEVSIDDNGEIKFNTSAYGVHTDVWVEEDEVEIPNAGVQKVPCLFAKSLVWKRFSSVVNLIANKMTKPDEYNGGLWSSWELQGEEWHLNEKKEKIYDKFTFLSNCLIDVPPAYSTTSKTLAVASQSFETELSNAYLNDLEKIRQTNTGKEENDLPKNQTNTSALTTRDLHQKVYEALNPKGWNSIPYFSVWEIYPEDHKVLAYDIERKTEDEYLVFSYTVTDDVVTVGEGVITNLSKILAENKSIAEEFSEKDEALIKASEEIQQLQAKVAELTPFKEKVEALEQAEKIKEANQKKEELKTLATKGGLISEEEIETSEEIKALIECLDEKGIKALIAERFIKKLDTTQSKVEASQVNKIANVKANIHSDDDKFIDHKTVMSSFLSK